MTQRYSTVLGRFFLGWQRANRRDQRAFRSTTGPALTSLRPASPPCTRARHVCRGAQGRGVSVGSLARSLRLLPPFRYTFHCGIASASSPTFQPKRRGKSMGEWNARSSSDHQANAEDLGTNLRQHGGPHRCVCERVKLGRRLDGGFGKFKKFSGWQAVIFEKLSTDRHGVTGHEAGANRLVDFMARLRLSRLSAARMGAARRVSLCGSTVTVLAEPGTWRLGIRAGMCGQSGEGHVLAEASALGTSCTPRSHA